MPYMLSWIVFNKSTKLKTLYLAHTDYRHENHLYLSSETDEQSRQRFQTEVEFVQCLANPNYLNCKLSKQHFSSVRVYWQLHVIPINNRIVQIFQTNSWFIQSFKKNILLNLTFSNPKNVKKWYKDGAKF